MIDLKSIINSTTKYNFHSHTQFCDGRATMEEFVIEALAQGMEHYGFSPHSPINIPSPCNMSFEAIELYLDEFSRLKVKYGNMINLYASLEIDYLDGWGPANQFFQSLPLDYRIGSVHFIPSFDVPGEYVDVDGRYENNFKVKMENEFHDDIEAVVRSYFAQEMKLITEGGFDIIAHCDKISHNASCHRPGIDSEPWYDALVKQTFDAIMDHHYLIEVNTKAWKEYNRFFPNSRWFSLLKQYDAPIIFSSDAHYPNLVNAGRDKAMELFKNS